MEYQFTRTLHGVVARCSMEHEAFARWFNTELMEGNVDFIELVERIESCKLAYPNRYEYTFEGREYTLFLNGDEVIVKANHLYDDVFFSEEELEEGLNFYNEESIAFCGLEDFEAFLEAYQKFVIAYN